MKKLLLLILFVPIFACENDQKEAEPLIQYHFINLVDESGENLFKTSQISTSDFKFISGELTLTWEQIMVDNEAKIAAMHDDEFQQTVANLRKDNPFLLVEIFQGERERVISIKGKEHTMRMSPLQDGFHQNGELLDYSTDTVEKGLLYVHSIILDEY